MSNFRNVKIVSALRIGTDRAFHKAGPDIDKSLFPVIEQQIYLNLWSVDILSISAEQVQLGHFSGFRDDFHESSVSWWF